MEQTLLTLNVLDIKEDQLVGRPEKEVKAFAMELLNTDMDILYPILVVYIRSKVTVLDGSKRILALKWIIENTEDQDVIDRYSTIQAIDKGKLTPAERAAYSMVTNEQRSDNVLSAYLHYAELKKKGQWDKLIKQFNLKSPSFKKLIKLDDLRNQKVYFKMYHENKVALGTLFKVANLPSERQKVCLVTLREKGKLTGNDLREVRSMQADKVLATLDLDVPEVIPVSDHVWYVYLEDGNLQPTEIMTWEDALTFKGKGVLYRLVPAAGVSK